MIEQGLAKYLSAHSGVKSLIGDRLYPETAPDDPTDYPLVTYQTISDVQPMTLANAAGYGVARVQLDCWGKAGRQGYKQVKDVAEQLRLALHGYRGTMGDYFVQESRIDNMSDGGDAPAFGRGLKDSRVSVDVFLWYSDSVPTF
jgi:hypothetical protein